VNGELEFRAAEPVGVSWPKRLIELIVMPYETETVLLHQGRIISEICSRGAWDGIERRANRVRANRDHDVTRTVGRAHAFYPGRPEGLVAEVHVSPTPLGDETLTLAADGVLDVSAGFLPFGEAGEVWETRDRRRLQKCWLGHIAFTPDPAYETAAVLSVRSADRGPVSATPILDRILAERAAREYGLDL
jgi:phage head maturation protease